jgi:uncharacterized BrkB/YihY/UPF0761 family membrane protein
VSLAVLQSVSSAVIAHKSAHASPAYGTFGAVVVLLSWFYLQCQVLLFCAQINVVKQDRRWPRSIVEPPTDAAQV